MRRKSFFACASLIWATMMVFMATSVMADINVTTSSKEMTDNSTCDQAGTMTLNFTQADYGIMNAYLTEDVNPADGTPDNNAVVLNITLSATNFSGSPAEPVLCKDIAYAATHAAVNGASGTTLPNDTLLVYLDELGVEVSDVNGGASGADLTAYIYGVEGQQTFYIYITALDAAANWDESAGPTPWLKIGLTGLTDLATGLLSEDTSICADVRDFAGLNKITVSIQPTPLTLTLTGDNEIGQFTDPGAFTLDICSGTKTAPAFTCWGTAATTQIELCELDDQTDPYYGVFCFTIASEDFPANGMLDFWIRSNGIDEAATTQSDIYISSVAVYDDQDAAIGAAVTYHVANSDSTAIVGGPAAPWNSYVGVGVKVAVDTTDITGADAGPDDYLRVCVGYYVRDTATPGSVSLWVSGSEQPCGVLFAQEELTAAELVACGPTGIVADSMYFPYVLVNGGDWMSGVTVSNLSGGAVAAADMDVTFTLTDNAGTVCTYNKTDFTDEEVHFSILVSGGAGADDDLADFLDCGTDTLAAGSAVLDVDTNFKTDGFQFMTNGTFGAGNLPRLTGTDDSTPLGGP